MKVMDLRFQVWITLGILGFIIGFSVIYPFMKFSATPEQDRLNALKQEFQQHKSSTMPDAAKEKKATELQLAISNQQVKADAEKLKVESNALDLTQIIVLSALVLALIWILLHEVKIIAYFFTIVIFSIGVYTHLKNNLGIDLLDYDTQMKIFVLILGSLVSAFGCIFLFVVFNRSLHKKNMYGVLETMPQYAHEYARHEAYKGEAISQAIAYSAFGMMSENGHRKLNAFSNDDILPKEKVVEYVQPRPANNQQPANKVGGER